MADVWPVGGVLGVYEALVTGGVVVGLCADLCGYAS